MSQDLRRYARQTNFRLLIGFVVLLFVIGDGLVFVIWGPGAAAMGAFCLVGGLFPLVLVWGALAGLDWLVKKAREEGNGGE